MSRIVGVTGYAQHGKDTLGAELVAAGYVRYGFADKLKELALAIDPILGVSRDAESVRLSWLVDELGWEGAKQNPEVRRLLQEIGTQCRNLLGPNIWVKALEKQWLEDGCPNAVITDVRFPNEAEWVHRTSGTLIRVERVNFDNGIGTDHPSEAHVRNLPADIELYNDGTLEDWQRVAAEVPVILVARSYA